MADLSQPDRDAPIRVLLVKLKHIGDALLVTPTVMAIRENYPRAEIWVVVRKGTEGILAGCPEIDRLVTVMPVESTGRSFGSFWADIDKWRELRGQRFDYAFELTDGDRGRWLAGMSGARHRCANVSRYPLNFWWRQWFNRISTSEWTNGHRVEKDFQAVSDFLPLAGEIPPLRFSKELAPAPELIADIRDFAVFHAGTRWLKKRWPKDLWIELGKELLTRVDKIVISSGPDEQERSFANELIAELGADRVISTDGKLNWSGLAGLLYRARLFVGVDTAAMHLAAACQCPLVTIFAYSIVGQWAPWKAPSEVIHLGEKTPPRGPNQPPAEGVMRQMPPSTVLAAADRLIRPAVD